MSFSGIDAIDSSLQKTNKWLSEIYEELGLNTTEAAWFALHRVLHALRDRLPAEEVLQLSAQLPLIIRGAFFEGWRPQDKPGRIKTVEEFLRPLDELFSFKGEIEAEPAVRAVFGVLSRHVTKGEIEDVKACLPTQIRELWPDSMAA